MPDYREGSYILGTNKDWTCEFCKEEIPFGTKVFVRVKEYGTSFKNRKGEAYRHKNYLRWHIECCPNISDLNEYEINLLNQGVKV